MSLLRYFNIIHAKPVAVKVTLTAGVNNTVKASAGYVFSITTTLTDLVVKDGSTQVWANNYSAGQPFYCNTSIVLSSATGGTAYIVYL